MKRIFLNSQFFLCQSVASIVTVIFGIVFASSANAVILIGQTAGMTGPTAEAMKEINAGANLYFDEVNRKGGINGEQISLLTLDDKFDVAVAADNARKLIVEKNVVALFLSRGTAQTEALLPVLATYDVPLVAPSTGAMSLHEPVNKHVFNVRTTYQKEASRAVMQLESTSVKSIAVVYRNDSFGKDGLAGALSGFKSAGLTPTFAEPVDKSKADFSSIIAKAKALNPQAIVVIEAPGTAARAVNEFRAAGILSQIVVLSNCASNAFIKSLGANALGVIVSQVFPGERALGTPLIAEINNLAKAKKIDVSPALIEGFAAAKVLVHAMVTSAKPVNRKNLRNALDAMQNYDLGGLRLSFSPGDHTGLTFTDLSIIGKNNQFNR